MIQETTADTGPETSTTSRIGECKGHPEGRRICDRCGKELEYKKFSFTIHANGKKYYGRVCYGCKDSSRKEIRRELERSVSAKTLMEIHRIYLDCLHDSDRYADAVACIPELIETIHAYRKVIDIVTKKKKAIDEINEILPNDEYKRMFISQYGKAD